MSQERIEAAAKAVAACDGVEYACTTDQHSAYYMRDAARILAAADEVMFSDEAIERAENAVYSLAAINAPEIVRIVVASLKGDA